MLLTYPRTPTVHLCLRLFNNPAKTIWCNCGTLTHSRIQTVQPRIRIIFAWNCPYARYAYGQYAHFGAKWEGLDTYATHILLRLPHTYRHAHDFYLPWCQAFFCLIISQGCLAFHRHLGAAALPKCQQEHLAQDNTHIAHSCNCFQILPSQMSSGN